MSFSMPRELPLRDVLSEIRDALGSALQVPSRIAIAALFVVACSEETQSLEPAGSGDAGRLDVGAALDLGTAPDLDAPDLGAPDGGGGQAPSSGCGSAPPADGLRTLTFDRIPRGYWLRVPSSYDPSQPTPLVLAFHGFTSTAQAQEWLSRLTPVAEREGFIVAYPRGVSNSWNGGACCGVASATNVDDVGFAVELVDRLSEEFCVDANRVYALGFSNGGFFSHRLACERPDRFAAVGSVAGLLTVEPCSSPVPVMQFHGTEDRIVPYNGSALLNFPSVRDTIERWRVINDCGPLETRSTANEVRCDACTGDADVVVCTVDGGGHTWPGGVALPGAGRTTNAVSASEELWQFFSDHPKP